MLYGWYKGKKRERKLDVHVENIMTPFIVEALALCRSVACIYMYMSARYFFLHPPFFRLHLLTREATLTLLYIEAKKNCQIKQYDRRIKKGSPRNGLYQWVGKKFFIRNFCVFLFSLSISEKKKKYRIER